MRFTLWRVEADLIKWWVDSEKEKLLQETNSLLKQIWSSERIEVTLQVR